MQAEGNQKAQKAGRPHMRSRHWSWTKNKSQWSTCHARPFVPKSIWKVRRRIRVWGLDGVRQFWFWWKMCFELQWNSIRPRFNSFLTISNNRKVSLTCKSFWNKLRLRQQSKLRLGPAQTDEKARPMSQCWPQKIREDAQKVPKSRWKCQLVDCLKKQKILFM